MRPSSLFRWKSIFVSDCSRDARKIFALIKYSIDMDAKARRLGATDLRQSWRKGKKWAVLYDNIWIHFGSLLYDDFTSHNDPVRRASYRRRHKGILLRDGRPAYTVKSQPSYWAYHLLW